MIKVIMLSKTTLRRRLTY